MTKKHRIRFAKLVAKLTTDFSDTTRQSCELWRGDVEAILAAAKELRKLHGETDLWCGACYFEHDPKLGCLEAAQAMGQARATNAADRSSENPL